MKSQYNDKKFILVSLKEPKFDCKLKLIKRYRHIFLFDIDTAEIYDELKRLENAVCYLDSFILLLPEYYPDQKKMWIDLYKLIGKKYETMIETEHNLSCIEFMLNHISKVKQIEETLRVLDFGCGSGVSLAVEFKGTIIGYDPIKIMRVQAEKRGMLVLDEKYLNKLPDNYFDAVFSSYVLHMGIGIEDIKRINPKIKPGAIWIANFYKKINQNYINSLFKKIGFDVVKIKTNDERFGNVFEYRKK